MDGPFINICTIAAGGQAPTAASASRAHRAAAARPGYGAGDQGDCITTSDKARFSPNRCLLWARRRRSGPEEYLLYRRTGTLCLEC